MKFNVTELIEALQTYPQHYEVIFYSHDEGISLELDSIDELETRIEINFVNVE